MFYCVLYVSFINVHQQKVHKKYYIYTLFIYINKIALTSFILS